MAKSKKLLIDLCGVIVFFATAFFIMYAVTGKIPFFSEPRRNRRVSYRREKMDEGSVLGGGIIEKGEDERPPVPIRFQTR